jgi:hypothetical protein
VPVERDFVPASSGPSAANTAAIVTLEHRQGARIQVGFCHVSYSAAPAGGRITIGEPGQGPKFDLDITAAGLAPISLPGDGLTFENGADVVATLAAGGAAVVGKVNLGYRYIYDR